MKRLTELPIAGNIYYLNFSTTAAIQIMQRHGSLENLVAIFSENRPISEMFEELTWLLSVLIAQGAAYKKLMEGVDCPCLSQEDLGVVLGVNDYRQIKDVLLAAMTAGTEREVETEDPEDEKNVAATQEN